MKPIHQITADAVTIRGIIDYLEKSVEPVGLHELAMTQHISNGTALRLCRILEKAAIAEHPTVTRIVMGPPRKFLNWPGGSPRPSSWVDVSTMPNGWPEGWHDPARYHHPGRLPG